MAVIHEFHIVWLIGFAYNSCNGLTCYNCVTDSQFLNVSTGLGLDFSGIPQDPSCFSSASGEDTSCTHSCASFLVKADHMDDFAVRACTDTLLTGNQWSLLTVNPNSVTEECYKSALPATTTQSPATGRLCFCKSNKCNNKSWEASDGDKNGSDTKTLLLPMLFIETIFMWIISLISQE